MLLGGAGLLLLIANVNVAGLLLVRLESRKREIAVRVALGASAGRVMSQFMTEALALVGAGSLLGVASAQWAMRLLARLISADMMARTPSLQGLGLSVRVAAFAGVISLLSAALFSLAPGLRLWSLDVRDGLAEGGRGSAGTVWRRLGSKLVVLELATAMVLLVGAGLLGKSLYRLLHVDLGLRSDHLVTLDVAAPRATYGTDAQATALVRDIVARFERLPGVQSVGISTNGVPVSGNGNTTWFRVLGRPWHGEHNELPERDISPGLLPDVGDAVAARPRFHGSRRRVETSRRDRQSGVRAGSIFPATIHWASICPISRRRRCPSKSSASWRIFVRVRWTPRFRRSSMCPSIRARITISAIVVRTSQAERSLLPTLAAAVKQIDPGIVTLGGMTMADRIHDSPSAYLHRSSASLVGGFAALALLLGSVGLYGVIAYSVSQRTREIGVRMALGARPAAVYQLILGEAGWLAAIGISIGLACSVASATLMRGLLFDVQSWDVPTLMAVAVVLGLAALLASYFPARRAASVSPIEALRTE